MNEAQAVLDAVIEGASLPAFGLDLTTLRVFAVNDSFVRLVEKPRSGILGADCRAVCLGLAGSCAAVAGLVPCPVEGAIADGVPCLEMNLATASGPSPVLLGTITIDGSMALLGFPMQSASSATAEAKLRVHTLGRFEVRTRSGDLVHTRRPQALTLLKLLLGHRDHVRSESEITAALWPQGTPTHAREALRVLVYDLRHTLEPDLVAGERSRFIRTVPHGYAIPQDAPIDVDLVEFKRLAGHAIADGAEGHVDDAWTAARQALDLYRGDLFGSDPPAEWFAAERQALQSMWINVLLISSAIHARRGILEAALEESERAAGADLGNEPAQRQFILMLALHRGRAAASEFFVQLFRDFRKRYGLAPSRETAALVERLGRGEDLESLLREYCPLAVAEPPRP